MGKGNAGESEVNQKETVTLDRSENVETVSRAYNGISQPASE